MKVSISEHLNALHNILTAQSLEDVIARNADEYNNGQAAPVNETEYGAAGTKPDITETESDIKALEIDVKNTELDIETAELDVKNTELDIETAELDIKNTESDIETAELDVKNTEPVIEVAESDIVQTHSDIDIESNLTDTQSNAGAAEQDTSSIKFDSTKLKTSVTESKEILETYNANSDIDNTQEMSDAERAEENNVHKLHPDAGSEGDTDGASAHQSLDVKPASLNGNSTFGIVSTVGYLIGVAKDKFERDYSPLSLEVYNKLEQDKNARIIRNLCIVRTKIELNYRNISNEMRTGYRTILNMPEYIPTASLNSLSADGVTIYKNSNKKLNQHIVEINKNISNRINNCKNLFGSWIKWDYIRDLFIMPKGLEEAGTAEAASVYYNNKSLYPYQMYINWIPQEEGNILANDKKFMTLLYKWHGEYFNEYNKVSDADNYVKTNIHDFIRESRKLVLIVDCENSDPYKLCATLRGLEDQDKAKMSNIILVDDVHTATAWQLLENYVDIPVERIVTERIRENKSIVDAMFMVRACKEHYKNYVDSFIIVSSDSDYWPLIKELNDANFLVMVERDKCGPDMKDKLIDNKVFYCHIDDFYSGNIDDIRNDALMRAMYRYLKERASFNVNDMINAAVASTRIEMNEEERKRFLNRHIKPMSIEIDDDGNVNFRLKN